MGDVKDGDLLFDEQGKQCRVVKVHEVLFNRPCYKVVFSDHSEITTDAEHLWYVQSALNRQRAKQGVNQPYFQILSTIQIAKSLAAHYAIPVAKPLRLRRKKLLIAPYVLGAWLGDGATGFPQVCGADQQIFDEIAKCGYVMRCSYRRPGKDFWIYTIGYVGKNRSNVFMTQLKSEGLTGKKHIPKAYLRGSYQQRLELLQGLMDTDGCCHTSGDCVFTNTSRDLIDGVFELACSLGLKPFIRGVVPRSKNHAFGWTVRFMAYKDMPVFRLKRKLERQKARTIFARVTERRYIKSVKRVKSVPVRCISVDSLSHLYLIGKAMIPTHNTRPGAEETWWEACKSTEPIRHAVIAPTLGDLRRTCYEGESGLLNLIPEACFWEGDRKKAYNRSYHEVKLHNGSLIQGFSAGEPERLRGPQFHRAWLDELAAWGTTPNTIETMQAAWDMLMYGLRLVSPSTKLQVIVTTTPKPFPLVIELHDRVGKDFVLTTGSTYENRANLAKTFFDTLVKYEGTQLGEQEIHARILNLEHGGIYRRADFQLWPAGVPLPSFEYIVQSYDTAFTEDTANDPTAKTDWGVFKSGKRHAVMLLDAWTKHLAFPALRELVPKEFNVYYGADAPLPDIYEKVQVKPGTMRNPLIGAPALQSIGRKVDVALIEAKGSGISLIQEMGRLNIPVRTYNPGSQDKALRAHVVSHLPPAGLIYIPESEHRRNHPVSWAEDLLYQLCVNRDPWEIAPDDLLDTFTQVMRYLIDIGFLRVGDEAGLKRDLEYEPQDAPPKKRANPYG